MFRRSEEECESLRQRVLRERSSFEHWPESLQSDNALMEMTQSLGPQLSIYLLQQTRAELHLLMHFLTKAESLSISRRENISGLSESYDCSLSLTSSFPRQSKDALLRATSLNAVRAGVHSHTFCRSGRWFAVSRAALHRARWRGLCLHRRKSYRPCEQADSPAPLQADSVRSPHVLLRAACPA